MPSLSSLQVVTTHNAVWFQLLGAPDHPLCSSQCETAIEATVHRWNELDQAAAPSVHLRLPQQRPQDAS